MASTGWEAKKDEANEDFKQGHYAQAVRGYSEAIALNENSAVLYSNRAFAYQKLEQFGACLGDAARAIELDANFAKAFYRRGSANLLLGHTEAAEADFLQACKLEPQSREARLKLQTCRTAIREIMFQKAIETDDEPPLFETMHDQINRMADPGSDYAGPRLPQRNGQFYITEEFVDAMKQWMKDEKILHIKYAYWLVYNCLTIFQNLPSLLDTDVPEGQHITVCGDTHGQFYDLLNLFEIGGKPSETNPYLFNGDFVDRGSWSVEVVLTLFAYKSLYPNHFHLHRGNHETVNMNKMYGFEGEVDKKYSPTLMTLFTETFNFLPLASCVHSQDDQSRVLIVHGGLFSKDGVKLDDLRKIDRNRQPPDEGLMCEMLWSDPQPFPGRAPNKRGVGVAFGPDVTKRFCEDNRLDMIIRSHEVKEEGYLVEADGRLCTIFSAPNYCDQVGNKGAFIRFKCVRSADGNLKLEPNYTSFSAVPHPNLRPMAYAGNFSMFM